MRYPIDEVGWWPVYPPLLCTQIGAGRGPAHLQVGVMQVSALCARYDDWVEIDGDSCVNAWLLCCTLSL